MNLLQAIGYQRSAVRSGHPVGPIATPLCEGRECRNRTAPVFVVVGWRRAFFLCAACRTWRNVLIRAALPEIRKPR